MNRFIKIVYVAILCLGIGELLYKSWLNAINSRSYPAQAACSKEDGTSASSESCVHNKPIPSTFGRTHFIVGMSPDEVQELQKDATDKSLCSASGTYRQAFFSPDDGVEKKLIDIIDQEQESMKIAVFQFTNGQIARAIIRAHCRGVTIEIITDPLCLQDKFNKITWLAQEGLKIFVYNPDANKATLSNKMHHKFVIFGKNIGGNKLIWMGSFNFTKSADVANQESVVVLDDSQIIAQFDRQYDRLKKRSIVYKDFASNHVITQAWQPSVTEGKKRSRKKTSLAHAKDIYGHQVSISVSA